MGVFYVCEWTRCVGCRVHLAEVHAHDGVFCSPWCERTYWSAVAGLRTYDG